MKTRRKLKTWMAHSLWVGPAAILALIVGFQAYDTRLASIDLPSAPTGELEQSKRRSASGDRSELASSLLLDSILSIVQSYYVDEERVDNHALLMLALGRLAEDDPSIKIEASSEAVKVSVGDRSVVLPVVEDLDYQGLLDGMTKVAGLLDRAQGTQKISDASLWQHDGAYRLVNSMLMALDPHSAFLDPPSYKELLQGTEGAFGGLGVVVGIRDNLLTVIKPIPGSPAFRAGIRKHDRIMRINHVDTYGTSLDNLVEFMRGAPGTTVDLSLLRDGDISPADLSLMREVIQVNSVEARILKLQNTLVVHIAIESFSSRTGAEVAAAIETAEQKSGGKLGGIVLDLRSNPGGLLDQAVEVADLFLKDGNIVSTKGRREEAEQASEGYTEFDYPIAILINSDSASASEIVAGALQDHNRAVVIGQPSFGKGSVQTIFKLPGEQALKLTIARYYTPAGRSIQNIGIMPDIWLQPVVQDEKNLNLLGSYRYKNEAFLANHLVAAKNEAERAAYNYPYEFKGYYLIETGEDINDPDKKNDRELQFAMGLLAKISSVYGAPTPKGTRRSSHWLAVAAKDINARLRFEERRTESWLSRKYGVDWSPSQKAASADPAALELALTGPTEIRAGEGDTIKIPWTVRNNAKTPINRVSIFVRSMAPGFDTYEKLVGRVQAKATVSGEFEIPIALGASESPLALELGLAVDARTVDGRSEKFKVVIEPRDHPDLHAMAKLVEESGGNLPGLLEPKEKGQLEVTIVNQGVAEARGVEVSLVNLAGGQVVVDANKAVLDELKPGESRVIKVPIKASDTLVSETLNFGVTMLNSAVFAPTRQSVSVVAKPNVERGKISSLFSH